MNQNGTYGVTNDEIMDFLKENMVTKDELHDELGKLRSEFKEDMGKLRSEFKEDMGKLRSEFIDYLDKRLLDLKGDLVVIMKSEDRKLNALIELLVGKNLITTGEARTIVKLEPFPRAA